MSTVRPGNQAALLVVDVQVGVVAEAWERARVVGNVALAVERARQRGVPVIWVQHEDDDLVRDSAPWQWVPELAPAAGEARIFKRYESSFEDTPLEAELARVGATHVVLAGAMTNWCIRATAYGALDRGYDLTLIKDAHTTKSVDLPDGTAIAAAALVADLNIAMTWLSYPGRKTTTARAEEADFGTPHGGR
jgi:nicotinamidase-related amidase